MVNRRAIRHGIEPPHCCGLAYGQGVDTRWERRKPIAQSGSRGDADAAIRRLEQELAKSFNAREIDKFSSFYAPNAVVMPSKHESVCGHAAIREY